MVGSTNEDHSLIHSHTHISSKNEEQSMRDSGKRENFGGGAVRDTQEGKSRPDLISPFAEERLGDWLATGAKKYAERNWEKGMFIGRCVASMKRHMMKYMQGATDEDHMAAVMCNAMFILHFEEGIKKGFIDESLDDMPKYLQQISEKAESLPNFEEEELRSCFTDSCFNLLRPEDKLYCEECLHEVEVAKDFDPS